MGHRTLEKCFITCYKGKSERELKHSNTAVLNCKALGPQENKGPAFQGA